MVVVSSSKNSVLNRCSVFKSLRIFYLLQNLCSSEKLLCFIDCFHKILFVFRSPWSYSFNNTIGKSIKLLHSLSNLILSYFREVDIYAKSHWIWIRFLKYSAFTISGAFALSSRDIPKSSIYLIMCHSLTFVLSASIIMIITSFEVFSAILLSSLIVRLYIWAFISVYTSTSFRSSHLEYIVILLL